MQKINKFFLTFFFIFLFAVSYSNFSYCKITIIGDINSDGIINTEDSHLVLKHIISNKVPEKKDWKLSQKQQIEADVNKDNNINTADLLAINRYIIANKRNDIKEKHPEWITALQKYTEDLIEPINISINQRNVTLNLNATKIIQLTAIVTPQNSNVHTNVKWESTNPTVANVSQTGLVTALSEGETTIKATTDNGKSSSCTIKVLSLQLSNTSGSTTYPNGDNIYVKLIGKGYTNLLVESNNSSIAVAQVDVTTNTLEITPKGVGNANITLTEKDSNTKLTYSVNVKDSIEKLYFVNVGSGDATLVQTGNKWGLIDLGQYSESLDTKKLNIGDKTCNIDSFNSKEKQNLTQLLKEKNISRLDFIIISHFHVDHMENLIKDNFLSTYKPKVIYYKGLTAYDNTNKKQINYIGSAEQRNLTNLTPYHYDFNNCKEYIDTMMKQIENYNSTNIGKSEPINTIVLNGKNKYGNGDYKQKNNCDYYEFSLGNLSIDIYGYKKTISNLSEAQKLTNNGTPIYSNNIESMSIYLKSNRTNGKKAFIHSDISDFTKNGITKNNLDNIIKSIGKVDIVQAAHHGQASTDNNTETHFKSMNPNIVVISNLSKYRQTNLNNNLLTEKAALKVNLLETTISRINSSIPSAKIHYTTQSSNGKYNIAWYEYNLNTGGNKYRYNVYNSDGSIRSVLNDNSSSIKYSKMEVNSNSSFGINLTLNNSNYLKPTEVVSAQNGYIYYTENSKVFIYNEDGTRYFYRNLKKDSNIKEGSYVRRNQVIGTAINNILYFNSSSIKDTESNSTKLNNFRTLLENT